MSKDDAPQSGDTDSRPRVALVGRPNVGKSTLFNRLYGRREAIVHDRPGVTRDRIERGCVIDGRAVVLQDTGGIVPGDDDELLSVVTEQALSAVRTADVIVLVIDGRAGATPLDGAVAELLHEAGRPVVLAVNKIDVPALEAEAHEGWALGLGEPVPVSAEHALGIDRLVERIVEALPPGGDERPAPGPGAGALGDPGEELSLAIVGRPNVGKSSLVNRIAGRARVTVSPVPGTTRDAVDVVVTAGERRVRLVDTAGLRRRGKTAAPDESIGILLTRRRLQRAHVAVLVIDATAGLTSGDVGIAGEIVRAGRPLVVAANKWDLVEGRERATKTLAEALGRRLAFAEYAPLVTVSAETGQRVQKLVALACEVADRASRRVGTAALNRVLERFASAAPGGGAAPTRLHYATQTGTLPPRFAVFCRDPEAITPAFVRHVERRLRAELDLGPTPVVVDFRRSPRKR